MKLEDQICSLELAKRLKELGVKQKSLFVYGKALEQDAEIELFINFNTPKFFNCRTHSFNYIDKDFYSAFTVAELGEGLGDGIVSGKFRDKYYCFDYKIAEIDWREDNTEANARAKMLIYLIENGLVKI